jgi:hypothetical protein
VIKSLYPFEISSRRYFSISCVFLLQEKYRSPGTLKIAFDYLDNNWDDEQSTENHNLGVRLSEIFQDYKW